MADKQQPASCLRGRADTVKRNQNSQLSPYDNKRNISDKFSQLRGERNNSLSDLFTFKILKKRKIQCIQD